ncbi:MAG TPA: tRNA preQ1(34) S-adenosylmethionine ribosyltransferase-isomerase QueA [Candidatus Krumholzibacteria bacterium]|nr:tRNA preQ1(34) S-adenosylmethionine ribosyltransferase-isomerase QueA [Candidatus Krumholzibacteria bacterium]
MRLEDLDFDLPAELIAQVPAAQRDACNLLHLHRASAALQVRRFDALPELLRPRDLLVLNASRVLPARLLAERAETGGRCELLLVEPETAQRWWALARPARSLRPGARLRLADGSEISVTGVGEAGRRLLDFGAGKSGLEVAHRLGTLPLPPYIRRQAEPGDAEAYQTVFARVEGSVAAPTAGLHFTPELLDALARRGISSATLVLHIGPGTFAPLRSSDPLQHRMDWERFEVERAVLERCRATRQAGGRVVAVGTTATRVLESLALWEEGAVGDAVAVRVEGEWLRGRTRLFIHPPFDFRRVDALLTNFHLPRSTLLLLVDAFAGRTAIRRAYAEAVARRLRFFSYGDAMLIE